MDVPVGFEGEATITAAVCSVQASATAVAESWKRVAAVVGTATTLPP
jgi:hypothetical protein